MSSIEIPITSAPERRADITARIQAETGIDEAMIEKLVRGFYVKVQADPLLGPVFAERISDWEPHLQRMMTFWSSLALLTGRYHGQPMPKHMALPIDAVHFDRWLTLFEAEAQALCPPAAAGLFIDRARRIAASLELGIAGARGTLLKRGQRLSPTPADR